MACPIGNSTFCVSSLYKESMIQRNRKTDNLAIEVPLFIITYLFSFRFNFGALSGTPMTAIPANSLLLAFLSGTMELA
jgi:hypothetical protein